MLNNMNTLYSEVYIVNLEILCLYSIQYNGFQNQIPYTKSTKHSKGPVQWNTLYIFPLFSNLKVKTMETALCISPHDVDIKN